MVTFCKVCGQQMKTHYCFEPGKSYTYMACHNCHYESKPKKMFYNEIPGMEKFEEKFEKNNKVEKREEKRVEKKFGSNKRGKRVTKWV